MTDLPIFAPALPEMFLACAAMGLMMVGVYANKERALKLVTSLAILALVLTGGLVLEGGSETRLAFGGLFRADGFGLYMKLLVLLGSILTILMSDGYIRRENMARFEYPVLIVFATLGMLMMISANGLISLYIGLELQSLALYVIASFQRDSVRSTEAGLKYFVLGSVSSGLLLYGCSLIYGFSGTTSFDGLAQVFSMSGDVPTGVVIGIVFLCAGLAFKISAVPFHMWTPDVYEGAPTPVTSFFAVAPKIAAIALFVRVMIGPFGGLEEQWRQVIVAISVGSMFVGAFAALVQTNIKRLMAYSSIGHIGYALIGLAAGTEEGTRGILVYMAIYLFMNVGTFAVILSMKVKDRMVENISDLAGLSKTRPGMAFALLVFMFSMAGVPPMAGFIGKIAIFYSAVNAGLVPLAVIGVIASVVSAFYYLRIVKVMYFDDPAEAFDRPEGRAIPAILVITTAFTALFILWPDPVINSAAHAAGTLFGG